MNPFLPRLLWVVLFITATEKQARPGGAWRCCTKIRRFGLSVRWSGISGWSSQGHNIEALAEGYRSMQAWGTWQAVWCCCIASLVGMVDCLGVSVCDTSALLLSWHLSRVLVNLVRFVCRKTAIASAAWGAFQGRALWQEPVKEEDVAPLHYEHQPPGCDLGWNEGEYGLFVLVESGL